MRNFIILLMVFLAQDAFAKSANQVYVMPGSGYVPGWGQVALGSNAAVTGESAGACYATSGTSALQFGTLGYQYGGTNLSSPGTSGNFLQSNGASWSSATVLGIANGGTGASTAAGATAALNVFVGDSGSGGTKGLVPAPASGDGASSKLLKADGTWTNATTFLLALAGGTMTGPVTLKTYIEPPFTVSSSGTPTFTWTNGSVQKMSVTSNITSMTFSGAVSGNSITIYFTTTGSYTYVWPSGVKWTNSGNAPIMSTTSGYTDVISFYYDGTTYWGFVGGLGAH